MEHKAEKNVVVRFPPSPTGFLHIGRARTALFNFLFARQNKGKLVFRIEDTDSERSKKEYEADIIENLKWLGITYDEGPVRQSERSNLYKDHLKKMVESGHAYISKETEGERGEVIRFKNPNKKITFTDLVRGEIEFDTTDLKDFVIAKSLEEPLYHLAVVVDDYLMGITHIIRGEDGISNTPRQILIQEAIGAPRPLYAHIPLILAPDRSKLSGRHGAVSVIEYKKQGYLPEAIVNYLALLGLNPGNDVEIFSMQELIEKFNIDKVQKSGAIFNVEKLNWVNKEWIKKLPKAKLCDSILEFVPQKIKENLKNNQELFRKLIPIITERIHTFGEIRAMAESGELDYYFDEPVYPKEKLIWKESSAETAKTNLEKISGMLKEIPQA